jgi:hypothetical protein
MRACVRRSILSISCKSYLTETKLKGVRSMARAPFDKMNCPNPVTWVSDIKNLFTLTDIEHMKRITQNALDLSDYDSVKMWATKIYSEVSSGTMPPPSASDEAWTPNMVQIFGCWIQQNCPEK